MRERGLLDSYFMGLLYNVSVILAAKEETLPPVFPLAAGFPRLTENSHPGHRLPTALLHPPWTIANSNTASGLDVFLYDEGVGSRCTGKERDTETGLDYFLARYYSGAQGRFTSPDEFKGGIVDPLTGQDIETNTALPYADIADPQTLNKYAYVRNNPLRYTDPDGHCFFAGIDTLACGAVYVGAAAVTGAFLASPQGQKSVRATVEGLGLLVNTAVEGIGSIFRSEARPGTRGKPDHQDTADEEAQKIDGGREVRIETPGGAKGRRVADVAKTEGKKVTDVGQIYRPTPKGNIPKREVEAARDIEKATGVKPRMVPVRPQRPPQPPKPPKLPNELEGR